MLSRTRVSVILGLLGIAVAASAFLLTRDRMKLAETIFLNNQALYAEVSAGATQALSTGAPTAKKARVPILAYHIVRPSYPDDDQRVRAIALTPEVFDAEMKYLRDAGYHVISLGDLRNYFQKDAPLPSRPIIITFDDGWRNQFEYGFPILQKYHYPATFFVFTNPIGTRGFVTWDNLRTMLKAGMTIGSHSRSHPYLTKITDPAVLWSEIYESKQKLEKTLGITINEFAYPFGQYNAAIEALVEKAGYASARGDYYNGGSQSADLLYELNTMNAPTTTALFAQKFPAY